MRSTLPLAAMLLALHGRPARACECAAPAGPVSPADGATNVPLNAALFFDTSLEPVLSITLTDSNGAQVPVTLEPHGRYLLARPMAALAARATYTVATDRGTTYTTHFTIGTAEDHEIPSFTGVSAIVPRLTQFPTGAAGSDTTGCVACDVHYSPTNSVSRIRFSLPDPPADAVLLGVQIYRPGDSNLLEEVAFVPDASTDLVLGFRGCAPLAPDLDSSSTYCARVIAYDAAGNAAGGTVEACAVPTVCSPQFDVTTCSPTDSCAPIADSGMDPVQPPSSGGCSTGTGAGSWLLVLALAGLRRRR